MSAHAIWLQAGEGGEAWLEIGFAARPMRGHAISGDLLLTVANENQALVVLVDGLGHGAPAAKAAAAACDVAASNPTLGPSVLMRRIHKVLAGTVGSMPMRTESQHAHTKRHASEERVRPMPKTPSKHPFRQQ